MLKTTDSSDPAILILCKHSVVWTFHRCFKLSLRLGLGNSARGADPVGWSVSQGTHSHLWFPPPQEKAQLPHSLSNIPIYLPEPFKQAWSSFPLTLAGGLSFYMGSQGRITPCHTVSFRVPPNLILPHPLTCHWLSVSKHLKNKIPELGLGFGWNRPCGSEAYVSGSGPDGQSFVMIFVQSHSQQYNTSWISICLLHHVQTSLLGNSWGFPDPCSIIVLIAHWFLMHQWTKAK